MIDVITNHFDVWTTAQFTKSTLGRGSNGKQSAYGIKKVRELILGMSLRGLFDEENKSVPETIEQDIATAKDIYFKLIEKKPKEYNFGPAILNEFGLPNGWMWKRVGELCDLQTGATPSRQKPEYFDGDIRWLVSGDINQGVIEDCEGRITKEGLESSNCKILPINTVLIALNGQGKTRATVALLKVPAACNQSLVGMIPFDSSILDSMFLLLSLRYRYFEIRDITGQKQRRGLNMGLVSELSIPLPPIAEQHRIVAKVDELMALCDQLEQEQTGSNAAHQTLVETLLGKLPHSADQNEFATAWQRIVEHFDTLFTTEHSIDQLKQTILQFAVMGKLVHQDPNDEPASVLLEKISRERGFKNQNSFAEICDEEMPFDLPVGWEWVRLHQIIHISSGDGLTASNMNNEGDIPVYGGNGITGYHDKANVSKPTLVIGRVGYYCGSVHITPELAWITDNAFITTFLEENIYIYFLYWLLKGTNLKENENATAQPVISGRKLYPIVIGLPPVVEQRRIVAKVDELMALCDSLKAHINQAQTTQIHLADTIVEQSVA